jgi:hypothetical protein
MSVKEMVQGFDIVRKHFGVEINGGYVLPDPEQIVFALCEYIDLVEVLGASGSKPLNGLAGFLIRAEADEAEDKLSESCDDPKLIAEKAYDGAWYRRVPGCTSWERENMGMRLVRRCERNQYLVAEVSKSYEMWKYRVEPNLGSGKVDTVTKALSACDDILMGRVKEDQ